MVENNRVKKVIGIGTDTHYRHEWKHMINMADLTAIRARLRAVAEPDPHAVDGRYLIRSLYFDNARDKALRDALHSPLFMALQSGDILLDDHSGGCVLYEKREFVEQIMAGKTV